MAFSLTALSALPPVLTDSPADLARAAELLRAGEIVALPTETVYGLAADALNPEAARKVFAAKGRPFLDPLIVHVPDLEALATVAVPDPRLAKLAAFWPGPLTVVLPRRACVPDIITAGKDTVAVRIPSHPVFREVLRLAGRPLAAPSANPFGYVSPTTAAHVRDSLGERCPWIVDGGPCAHGVESSIIDLTQPGRVRLLRPGPVSAEQLTAALGPLEVVTRAASQSVAQDAPGMLERHYSPNIPVFLFGRGEPIPTLPPGAALVLQARRDKIPPRARAYYLSERGDAAEAAHGLFALLRQIDREHHSIIIAELAEPAGVGAALNDRLRRAAAR